jgi:hypothetical protein
MKQFLSFVAISFVLGLSVAAAPLERDLGRGLVYHRAHHVPADLPAARPAGQRALVLDLRYAQGDAAGAAVLRSWLQANATPRTPVFLLANTETNPALLAPLAGRRPVEGVLILGAEAPGFQPDIALKISPEAERLAYDALEGRSDIDTLLKENADKVRNDEARLSKDRQPDSTALDDSAAENGGDSPEKAAAAKPPRPVIDIVLQRAVHLHRGLLALKRI